MWSKKAELEYWNAHNDTFYISNILKKYKFFDVDSYFDDDSFNAGDNIVDLVIDIGGGAFGGALSFFFKAKNRILVDALAKEYRMLGKLNSCIDTITANFSAIPLVNEAADVIFCWNTLDHADDLCHFNAGMTELARLVAESGLLFLSVPLRKQANDNHPLCIKRKDVVSHFNGFYKFEILNEFTIGEPHYRDETLFIVARKLE